MERVIPGQSFTPQGRCCRPRSGKSLCMGEGQRTQSGRLEPVRVGTWDWSCLCRDVRGLSITDILPDRLWRPSLLGMLGNCI